MRTNRQVDWLTDGLTDMSKLILAFSNFVNVPKNVSHRTWISWKKNLTEYLHQLLVVWSFFFFFFWNSFNVDFSNDSNVDISILYVIEIHYGVSDTKHSSRQADLPVLHSIPLLNEKISQDKQHSGNAVTRVNRFTTVERSLSYILMESTLTHLPRSGDILTGGYNRSVSSSSGADILLNAYYTGHM